MRGTQGERQPEPAFECWQASKQRKGALLNEIRKITPQEIAAAVAEVNRELKAVGEGSIERIDCSSENIEQGLARLVLSLVELLRRLLERQAIRRMEGGSLGEGKIEEMGQALMKLEAKVYELAAAFGLKPEDLNLELGPLGNLLDK
ncbi:MAG TPA: gas vesicle protein K [Candidatus Angelobacter sp.]|nr:gas vesicle protein K [Candidatus Angelobacter sp.]